MVRMYKKDRPAGVEFGLYILLHHHVEAWDITTDPDFHQQYKALVCACILALISFNYRAMSLIVPYRLKIFLHRHFENNIGADCERQNSNGNSHCNESSLRYSHTNTWPKNRASPDSRGIELNDRRRNSNCCGWNFKPRFSADAVPHFCPSTRGYPTLNFFARTREWSASPTKPTTTPQVIVHICCIDINWIHTLLHYLQIAIYPKVSHRNHQRSKEFTR